MEPHLDPMFEPRLSPDRKILDLSELRFLPDDKSWSFLNPGFPLMEPPLDPMVEPRLSPDRKILDLSEPRFSPDRKS